MQAIEFGKVECNGEIEETKKISEAQELLKISVKPEEHDVGKSLGLKNSMVRDEVGVGVNKKQRGWFKSLLKAISDFLDLELLKNSVYLNVIIGLSLFNVAETNFKLMTPFFLRSVGKIMSKLSGYKNAGEIINSCDSLLFLRYDEGRNSFLPFSHCRYRYHGKINFADNL